MDMMPSGSGSMTTADFSDHFVVRRQPDKNRSICEDSDEAVQRTGNAEPGSNIGDQLREGPDGRSLDDDLKEPKRLLTPFRFSRKSPISSLFDRKRYSDGRSESYIPSADPPRPVPGRPKVISEPIIPPGRSTTSLLRPFTAIGNGPCDDRKPEHAEGHRQDCAHDGSSSALQQAESDQSSKTVNGANLKPTTASLRRLPFDFYTKPTVGQLKTASQTSAKGPPAPHKPNVYRNANYTPSAYIPLVPGPLSEVSQTSELAAEVSSKNVAPLHAMRVPPARQSNDDIPAMPPPTASVPYMRPKTAMEGRFPYGSKPSVDSMVRPPSSTFSRIPKPGAVHPYLNTTTTDSSLGLLKSYRQEVTSPLSPFYPPIRQYVTFPEGKNSDMNLFTELGAFGKHSIFRTCSQEAPIPLHVVFDSLINIRKVGEGVYGEVYKAYFRGFPDQRVYKVVPIEGSKIVNGEKQKRFEEIEPEIIVSQQLNRLRTGYNGCYTDGHSKLLYVRICQGIYPDILVDQWKSWHRTYVSQNDLPEFDASQLYAVFEYEYHGTDIESYKFRNARQSLAVYLHVIHALAAAEAALEFEHRDLHWGNILVLKTREPYTTYTIQGSTFRVPNCGLKSTVIDYTISRLTHSTTGEPIFTDLANDKDQFCGSEDYQFEIYRMMRDENQNNWSKFCPKTNIFWAHYLVGKLIDKGRYSDVDSPTHHVFRNKLCRIQNNILKYSSCMECVRRYLPQFCRDLDTSMF